MSLFLLLTTLVIFFVGAVALTRTGKVVTVASVTTLVPTVAGSLQRSPGTTAALRPPHLPAEVAPPDLHPSCPFGRQGASHVPGHRPSRGGAGPGAGEATAEAPPQGSRGRSSGVPRSLPGRGQSGAAPHSPRERGQSNEAHPFLRRGGRPSSESLRAEAPLLLEAAGVGAATRAPLPLAPGATTTALSGAITKALLHAASNESQGALLLRSGGSKKNQPTTNTIS